MFWGYLSLNWLLMPCSLMKDKSYQNSFQLSIVIDVFVQYRLDSKALLYIICSLRLMNIVHRQGLKSQILYFFFSCVFLNPKMKKKNKTRSQTWVIWYELYMYFDIQCFFILLFNFLFLLIWFSILNLIWKKLSYYEMPFVHLNNKYKSLHKYINSIIQTNNIMIKIDILGVSKKRKLCSILYC